MKPPYALIPVVILVLLVYLITFLASRVSIIRNITHRKIWNSLLLITFFVTASLGIILVLQVNYKIEIPAIDTLLTWHVNFGIAMALVAIIHFSWHIPYYVEIFRKRNGQEGFSPMKGKMDDPSFLNDKPDLEKIPLQWLAIIPGFSAIITQIIFLREFMSVFYGNELVLGIVLANWMILTGLGAYLGKYFLQIQNLTRFLFRILIFIGILPFLTVSILNGLKNLVFIEGSMVGFLHVFAWSGLLMLPYCILSGSLFTYLSKLVSVRNNRNMIYRVYSLEAIGSVVGGLFFNFILVFFLKTYQSLVVILTVNIICAFWFLPSMRKPVKMISVGIIWGGLLVASFFLGLDYFAKKPLFRNQEILHIKETPYGNLAITKTGDQLNFYENYILLFNTLNIISTEESVHYAMVQHQEPGSVLVISGGISGILDEILKYPVNRIDYVELNPWLIKTAAHYIDIPDDERIHIFNKDARLFLRQNSTMYDVILMNVPPPGSAQMNRYYTIEFFEDIKRSMNVEGVIGMSLPTSMNYLNEEAVMVNSIIYNTLKKAFLHVDIVPGEKSFFLASGKRINLNIASLVQQAQIENEYVNQYYIDDQLLRTRRDVMMESMNPNTEINNDFNPGAYLKQTDYWLSHFDLNVWWIWVPVFLFILFLVVRWNPIQTGMFTCGFSASAIELLLLITFQLIYGYVYHVAGIIITLFMAGLAIGPLIQKRYFPSPSVNHFIILQSVIGVFSILLLFFLVLMHFIDPGTGLIHVMFFVLTLTISTLTGIFFAFASRLQSGEIAEIASGIYSSDLIGSALGALVVTAILFPLLGLTKVLLLICGINFLSAIYTLLRRKSLSNNFVY